LQHRELVAAEARDEAARTGKRAQALGGGRDQRVAGIVAERVVDVLEVVDVDVVQRSPQLLVTGT
jgi:hypothetical protein